MVTTVSGKATAFGVIETIVHQCCHSVAAVTDLHNVGVDVVGNVMTLPDLWHDVILFIVILQQEVLCKNPYVVIKTLDICSTSRGSTRLLTLLKST